ncbi:MAG TPA: NIPSNAP family protein [Thermoanaerobaculia bacterium]|jgi:hypothetical protein|nr:NIPSNAP family protein [Thermoanaerobaculia bacterium]
MNEVFELRQYTMHPGKLDTLLELFEREFIAAQEAAGMRVNGYFLDADDPDRFVWFRSFPDMVCRKEALTRFYSGEVWLANRDTANATMIDSDDVLLLRLADGFSELRLPSGRFAVTVLSSDASIATQPLTLLQTEPRENDYPRLPVRNENVLVAITSEAMPHHQRGVVQRLTLKR